jgi:hypothetical protein
MPGQARLSVRQSPLLRGRFSFQDEVGGSSPPRPTIRHLTSGNGHPFVSGPECIAGQRSRPQVLRSCEPYNASDQQVQQRPGPLSEPFGSSHSGRRAHYRAGSHATAGLAVRGRQENITGEGTRAALAPTQADVSAAPCAEPTDPTSSGGSPMGRLSSRPRPTGLSRRAGRAGPGGTPPTLGG